MGFRDGERCSPFLRPLQLIAPELALLLQFQKVLIVVIVGVASELLFLCHVLLRVCRGEDHRGSIKTQFIING